MSDRPPLITLTTDFGQNDEYVGTMKGVLLRHCPGCQLIDISHAIEPQDISGGAFLFNRAFRFFPAGTVHLLVVDPGVGSSRKILALQALGQLFVAPDNGLLTPVLQAAGDNAIAYQVIAQQPSETVIADTFHGRDIMAPAAARLASGEPLAAIGPQLKISDCHLLPSQPVVIGHHQVSGEVLHVDRFGNLITSITRQHLTSLPHQAEVEIRIGKARLSGIYRCYSEGPVEGAMALFDSHGHLEIAFRDGSAARLLKALRGTRVVVRARTPVDSSE